MRQGRPLGAADDVVGVFPFALEQHVCLADGVGLRVDLLSIEQAPHLLPTFAGDGCKCLIGHGEHAAGAAGAVVKLLAIEQAPHLLLTFAGDAASVSSATVSMPPVPQAQS